MSEIEKLEELRKRENELRDNWHYQKLQVTQKLYEILNRLNEGAPSQILQPKEDDVVSIEKNTWSYPNEKWRVRKEIRFIDPGETTYDFYSSFILIVTDTYITLNEVGCKEFTLQDKGPYSRLLLMKALLDNEQELISSLTPLIDFKIREELYDVNNSIYEIEKGLSQAKIAKEEADIKRQLKVDRYICLKRKSWADKKEYYCLHEKIIKICPKTVTVENDYGNKRRYNLDNLIYRLRVHSLYLVDSKEELPPQE